MATKLRQIIGQSTFTVIKGPYVCAKVSEMPTKGEYFMILKDKDAITIVTDVNKMKALERSIDETIIFTNVHDPKMLEQSKDEIIVVTDFNNLKYLKVLEQDKDDYSLIELNASVPSNSLCFLADVSSAIAKESMNILIISPFSHDYMMVRDKSLDKATAVLKRLGFTAL